MKPITTVNFVLTCVPIEGNLAAVGEQPHLATLGIRTHLNFTPLDAAEISAWQQTRRKDTASAAHVLTISWHNGDIAARLYIGLLIGFLGSSRLYTREGQYQLNVCEQKEPILSIEERSAWRRVLAEQGKMTPEEVEAYQHQQSATRQP